MMLKKKRANKEKAKRKRGLPPDDSLKTIAEWRLPRHLEKKCKAAKTVLFLAGLWLFGVFLGTEHRIGDWNDWKTLDRQGEIYFVPLIRTESDRCERGTTCYYAIYEYQDSERRQIISEKDYKALSNESTIEITAAGDVARIAGTRPDFSYIAIGLAVMWGIGLIAFLWGVRELFRIRSIENSCR